MVRCDFCGKGQDELEFLISGLDNGRYLVHICSECAVGCAEMVGEKRKEKEIPAESCCERHKKAMEELDKRLEQVAKNIKQWGESKNVV